MDPINEITRDADLVAALAQILPIVSAQKTTLSMTAQQVTDLTNLANAYTTQYGTMNTAKAAAKSAVTSKNGARKTMAASLNGWVKQWRANPNVSDALLAQLLCAPRNAGGPTGTPPNMPTELTAFANGLGDIQLKWNRNGNKPSTVYLIQTRNSASGTWNTVDAVTKSSYETSANPGSYIAFRLIATRGGKSSSPSVAVSLWDNGNSQALKLAA